MEIILLSVLGIVVLIIISGFLAGAETAITGVSQATIHRLKQEGDKRAIMVSDLRTSKEKLVSSLLLGNGVCNNYALTLSLLALTHAFDEEVASLIAPPIMTFMVFVFAEMVPKTYAFEHSEKYALSTAPVLIRILKVLSPLINTLQILVDFILAKCTKSTHASSMIISSTDELRGAIDLHHSEGAMIKADRDMLGSILDLRESVVTDVMVHRSQIQSINIEQPILHIMKDATKTNHTRIPVWSGNPDNFIGMINMTDFIREIEKHQGDLDKVIVKNLVTPIWFVPETTTLIDQLNEFRHKRNHFALVIDEYGSLKGLITLEDIIEVIVGQIDDEHDQIEIGIKTNSDGSYIVRGDMNLLTINRELNISLPTYDSSTLAGYIMHEAQKIPEIGESYILSGIKFTIIEKTMNQIIVVKVETSLEEDD